MLLSILARLARLTVSVAGYDACSFDWRYLSGSAVRDSRKSYSNELKRIRVGIDEFLVCRNLTPSMFVDGDLNPLPNLVRTNEISGVGITTTVYE